MNQIFASALSGLWPLLGLAVLLAILGAVFRSPRFKGWMGERAVQKMIRANLNPLVYVDVHNVTLPTSDGSTQIDHLLFSPYGVFVLETKNLKGWIFGSERQAQWTQQIFKHRNKFQNPLRQNYKHTQNLQKLLKLSPEHVHSVIAFVGESEFKSVMPPQVTQGLGFVAYIQGFQQVVWSQEQVQALLDQLEQVRLQPNRATQVQHVKHVKALKAQKQEASSGFPSSALEAKRRLKRMDAAEDAKTPAASAHVSAAHVSAAPLAPYLVDVDIPVVPFLTEVDIPLQVTEPAKAPLMEAVLEPVQEELVLDLDLSSEIDFTAHAAPVAAPEAEPAAPAALLPPAPDAALCPQCSSLLRKLTMQRGPLAGQTMLRCSNTASCSFVRADS